MKSQNVRPPALTLQTSAILLCAGFAMPVHAVDRSWNAGSGNWGVATHWSPVGVPAAPDIASIGDLAGVSNGLVTFNMDPWVSGLVIEDGMTVRTNSRLLSVTGLTSVSGQNSDGGDLFPSTLRIQQGAAYYDATTEDLLVSDDARVVLQGGAGFRVYDLATLESGGSLTGEGFVDFYRDATVALSNNGHIRATGAMALNTFGTARVDLDGSLGHGIVTVDTQDGTALTITGDSLVDAFGGEIHLTSDSRLSMNLADGWAADASSSISVEGILDLEPRPAAVIAGFPVTIAGLVEVDGFSGSLTILSDAVMQPTAVVEIGGSDRLQFWGVATINGGEYTLGQGAELDFIDSTKMLGGTFNTFGTGDEDGDVNFWGQTEWAGNVAINGRAQQQGDATVTAATTIDAEVFDFGGDFASSWDVEAPLTINTEGTGGAFAGIMDIAGGLFPRLTVNLTGQQQSAWGMTGTLNMVGQVDPFFLNRLAGSTVLGFGAFNIDGNVEVTADVIFMPSSVVSFDDPSSDLRMRGETYVREGTTFNGQGGLINGIGGQMWLYDGTSLGASGLTNDGELTFRRYNFPDKGVLASVDRFTNDDDGTLRVRIGGPALGEDHDHIVVTGGAATLDGAIAVDIIEHDTGFFTPNVGDEFTILTAVGGVSGTFTNSPASQADGITYHWTVEYEPNSVVLRVDHIDGCPADLAPPFGILNLFDFLAFQTLYSNEDARADLAAPFGVFNLFDFLAFQTAFGNGC